MPVLAAWFLYVSWMTLFLSIVCIIQWLHLKHRIVALRQTISNAEHSAQNVVLEKYERSARVVIKCLLATSMILLILHFVFATTN